MTTIHPNLRKYVQEGISNGTVLARIDELSPLQRLLYQDTDFHFVGNSLLKKKEEFCDRSSWAVDGCDYQPEYSDQTMADPEIKKRMANDLIDRIEREGKTLQELTNEKLVALGMEVRSISLEELEKVKDNQFKTNNIYNQYYQNLDTMVTTILEEEEEASEPKDDAMDRVVGTFDINGRLIITTQEGLELSLDNTSINSPFFGAGYSAPRDSYKIVRLLQYEVPTESTAGAETRQQYFRIKTKEIDNIKNIKHLTAHRQQLLDTYYQQDKKWRSKWGRKAQQKIENRVISELTIQQKKEIKEMKCHEYTVGMFTSTFKARIEYNKQPSATDWRDIENIKVSTTLGQLLTTVCIQQEIIPETITWTEHIPAGPKLNPNIDEESLRCLMYKNIQDFFRSRKQATTELNFTLKQWSKIFDLYESKRLQIEENNKINLPNITETIESLCEQITQCKTKKELNKIKTTIQQSIKQGTISTTMFLQLRKLSIVQFNMFNEE